MTADQNRVNSGFIPSPPNTAQANRAHKAQERKLARLREREQKQALRVQEDEQRRRDRQARDESAAQALLRYEARKAQEEEQRRVFAIQQVAKKAQEAEGRKLAKLRERERKQALYDQQDEQRRRDRLARDEAAMQALLRHKAIAEAKKAQDTENYRLREEQKMARERAREQKRLLRDQQDEQRRLDRQARDEACMQALLRYEAATKEKRAQELEERKLVKLRERERKRALRDQQDGQGQITEQKQFPRARSRIDRDSQRLAATEIEERQAIWNEQERARYRDRGQRDEAGARALQRHKAAVQAQRVQQQSLTEGRVAAFDGALPSFLEEEYQYMKQASTNFPEAIPPSIQMECIKAYQKAISDASRRLPCGLCGGLFQEDEMISVGLQDDNLQYFLRRTKTAPDYCAVTDNMVSLCTVCSSAIAKRAIPLLSAGNFVNCLFCQDYPEALKNLNAVEEAFIARAHVVGVFLKLTSGAKQGISYRGSRGHSVAVRQDPSELLKILPTRRLRDRTTITVSWDRGTPPSEENLARFCSVDKTKVLNALLWLCVNNPVYKSVIIDNNVLDSWPDHHIPQEIRDAFVTLGSESDSTATPLEDEREGYATSLQDGLFENELDAEVEDVEPGTILSRSFFSDLHGQDLHPTPATLASLQAILQEQDADGSTPNEEHTTNDPDSEAGTSNNYSQLPHISYKTTRELPLINSFTDPDYFTAAFPTLFPFGIGGHLGDAKGDRPEEISLKAFAKYTMLHHSLL
jgi:hypothetical protein